MANFQEKIAKLFPDATFEGEETVMISIPDAKWHDLALALRDDEDCLFDYLVTIVGMDWTDQLGSIYYLMSSKYNTMVGVKVTTSDRERPMLHSVADVWKVACLFEREVYDFFGIIFIGNPDMRRLFLSIDWKGYPLRKIMLSRTKSLSRTIVRAT